jgi:hypothetical protein
MKNYIIFILFVALFFNLSCRKEKVIDTVITISGVIKNSKDTVLTISLGRLNKKIKLTKEGRFSDTLKVEKTKIYRMFFNRSKSGFIFLKNGYNLELTGDADNFFLGFKYKGKGADSNNLLIAQHNYSKETGSPKSFLALDEAGFKLRMERVNREIDSISSSYANADTVLINIAKKNKERFTYVIENMYHQNYDFE